MVVAKWIATEVKGTGEDAETMHVAESDAQIGLSTFLMIVRCAEERVPLAPSRMILRLMPHAVEERTFVAERDDQIEN